MSDETSVVRTIGRYHAVGELGRGGMGVVYRGFDPVIGRTVALKTIAFTSSDADSRQLRERLYREASAAGTLTHANIVTIYDVIEDGDTTAVAMEFVEGNTLADLIAEKGPLPLDRAMELFEQICAALDYAGARGLVHRDIKPANILLTADGHAKITDFGIARVAVSGLTQTGTIMGSPSYMSPEQVRGQPLDRRSDLFSAAVVLYEMLAGVRPFGGDDVATTMYRIVNEPPQALEQHNPTINPQVSAVLARALAKDPASRHQTGAELVADLKRSLNRPGLFDAPLGVPLPAAAGAPRRSPLLYVIAGLGVVLAAVLVFALAGGDPPEQAAQNPAGPATGDLPPAAFLEPAPVVEVPPSAAAVQPVTQVAGPVSTVPPPAAAAPARLPDPNPAGSRGGAAGGVASVSSREPGTRASTRSSATRPAPEEPPARTAEPAPARVPAAARPAAEEAPAPAPIPPPPSAGEAAVRIEFEGLPYAATLYADDTRLGRVESSGSTLAVPPGTVRLRAVNEAIFLDADLGTVAVRSGERKNVSLPGTASVVVGVRGDEYTGLRILVDGRPLQGPYPAQVARIAAGAHQITYRWIGGTRAGADFSDTVTLTAGGHFVIRAVPDSAQIIVQQVR